MFSPKAETYLKTVTIPLRLSSVNLEGWPVVQSMWYLYRDQHLYCATPGSARIVSYLAREPRCGFEVAADTPPYCGLRGRAYATIEPALGIEILELLLLRYVGGLDNPLARQLLARSVEEVAIVLSPATVHTWNFTRRMKDSVSGDIARPCPE